MTRKIIIGGVLALVAAFVLIIIGFTSAASGAVMLSFFCAAPAGLFLLGMGVGRFSIDYEKTYREAQAYREALAARQTRAPVPARASQDLS